MLCGKDIVGLAYDFCGTSGIQPVGIGVGCKKAERPTSSASHLDASTLPGDPRSMLVGSVDVEKTSA